MLGPQTQHKGTVYGDDKNAPKFGTRPAGAPQTAALTARTPMLRIAADHMVPPSPLAGGTTAPILHP